MAHFRLFPKAFLNGVIKHSTVEHESSQLDVEVPNVSPAHIYIYIYIYIYIDFKNYVVS